jgi:hypothetical protein
MPPAEIAAAGRTTGRTPIRATSWELVRAMAMIMVTMGR